MHHAPTMLKQCRARYPTPLLCNRRRISPCAQQFVPSPSFLRYATTLPSRHLHPTASPASYVAYQEIPKSRVHGSKILDGVLARPLTCRRLVSRSVGLVHVCNLGHKRVVRVGVCQHRADRQQDCVTLFVSNSSRY